MSVNLLLVGSTDRQLQDILRACGMINAPVSGAELATLAQPGTNQPDVWFWIFAATHNYRRPCRSSNDSTHRLAC